MSLKSVLILFIYNNIYIYIIISNLVMIHTKTYILGYLRLLGVNEGLMLLTY